MSTMQGKFSNLQKQIVLAVVVLSVGVPLNYYMFSTWQGVNPQSATPQSQLAMNSAVIENAASGSSDRSNIDAIEIAQLTAGNPSAAQQSPAPETALQHAEKHSDPNYVCPMHPEIVTDDPDATCPICGMDLVVLENLGEADIVELTPTVMNALGVRKAKVKRRTIYRKISSVGYITFDEKNIRRVALRTEGWIEKLSVKSVGERVKKGDLLFQVYAPKLVNAQEEYVQALDLDLGDGQLISASRARLRALGISLEQIEELSSTKAVTQLISIYAPQDGVIADLNAREGDFIPRSTSIVSLVDLSSVWLLADIFESQVDWLTEGQSAEARLPYMPEKIWEGSVEYIYPSLDPKTRSVKARLRFDNIDESLKPNMYANVVIFAQPKRKALTVPREAVIRTDGQARVIVAQGEGRFKPMIIHTGIETDSKIEILGGLEEGQEVVVSSQFLIDSESSMRAALMRMSGG